MKRSLVLIIVSVFAFFFFLEVKFIKAASCPDVPLWGDYTVATSCTFAYKVDGVEASSTGQCGNLYVGDGVNSIQLTINTGYTVVWNPGCQVVIRDNASIWIAKGTPGGQLRKTFIWAKDIDNDGVFATDTFVAQDSNPGGGSKRRYELASWPSSFDCNDGDADIFQNVGTVVGDADHDGYDIGVLSQQCVGSATTVDSRTYYKYYIGGWIALPQSQSLGTDCCDCGDNSCYNTHPNQSLFFTVQNSCSSWDYDCDGTTTKNADCSGYTTYTLGNQINCSSYCGGGTAYDSCSVGGYTTKSCGESFTRYGCDTRPCVWDPIEKICYEEPTLISQNVTCGCK